MCCSGEEQKTESTTSAPAWLTDTYRRLLARGEAQSNKPYDPYTGQRVAGFNPDQEAAFQDVRDSQGVAQPYFDAAFSSAQAGAAPVTWQDVQAAYNPFIEDQVRSLQGDFDYQNQIAGLRTASQSTNAGVITGDRARVAEVLTEDAQRRSQDPQIRAMRTDAANRAWQGAEGNRDAAARGSQIYGQLGTQVQDSVGEDIQRRLAIGGAQQQNQQANNDWNFQQYLDQQRYPYQNIQWATGLAGVGPSFGMTSTGTTSQNDSLLGNVLGLGATFAGAYMSDERAKENIVPIGKTHDGQTIYRYNYVGDPTTQIGFIAQEVEQSHPEAVVEGPDGMKRVNYDLATRDAVPGEMPHKVQEGGFAYGGPVGTRMNQSEFDRLVGKVDTAVRSLRGHMNGGRAGYAGGGFVVPTAKMNTDMAATSFVPEENLSGSGPAQLMQAPPMQSGGQDFSGFNKLASRAGTWARGKSGGDAGLGSWAPTVTRAARGGVMEGLEEDDPLNGMTMPVIKADSSFASPQVMRQPRPSGVPGIGLDAPAESQRAPAQEKFYGAPATSSMGDAYMPPSMAPAEPPPAPTLGDTPAADGPAWYEPHEGKGWLDPNSNPDLGMALATAGAAMMGNRGSFFNKLGRGVGMGVGSYLSRADAERKQGREDREADIRAAQLEAEGKLRGLQARKTEAEIANEKLGKVVEVDKKAFLLKPDGTREIIYDGGKSQLGDWDNIKDKTSAEESLRKEFHAVPTVKDFMTMRDSYNRVIASSQNPDAAGDIALIYAYMKILDPGSVVRETEFATAENAAGVPDKMRNVFNKLQSGTRLGAEESELRKSFVDRARMLYDSQQKQYDRVQNYYGDIAKRQGLDTQNVLVDHSRVGSEGSALEQKIKQARDALKRGDIPREAIYEAFRQDGYDPKLLEQ